MLGHVCLAPKWKSYLHVVREMHRKSTGESQGEENTSSLHGKACMKFESFGLSLEGWPSFPVEEVELQAEARP